MKGCSQPYITDLLHADFRIRGAHQIGKEISRVQIEISCHPPRQKPVSMPGANGKAMSGRGRSHKAKLIVSRVEVLR